MLDILPPRDYQKEAIGAAFEARTEGHRRVSAVLATGLGKTVIFSHLAKMEHEDHGGRTAILVHRDELVKQTVAKIKAIAPHLSVGVVKRERREWNSDVVVISVQTAGRADGLALAPVPRDHFTWITIDECHHAATMLYQNIITHFGAYEPESKTFVLGVTATLMRADKLGLGDTFEKNIFKRDIIFGIRNGFLVSPKAFAIHLAITKKDLTGSADYTDVSVSKALLKSGAAEAYLHAIREHCADRQGIIFMPSKEAAFAVADVLNEAGFPTECVVEDTTSEERDLIFKRVIVGETQILVNVMVLTEGFDLPQISFVIPGMTKNEGLFAQEVGRGLRPSKSFDPLSPYPWRRSPKVDCIVLCPAGGEGLRLVTIADLSPTTKGKPIEDGDSLIDLEDEITERREKKAKELAGQKKVTTSAIDLFASSSSDWLQTEKGYWFLPLKDWLLVLYPEDTTRQTYMLGTVYSGYQGKRRGNRYGEGMELEYAKVWGESVASELDPSGTYSGKKASWKTKKAKASEAQKNFAGKLGIGFDPETITKGEIGRLINLKVGTKILDRYEPPAPKEESAA